MSQHPILPIDRNEHNTRKIMDKTNELVRHVSVAPSIRKVVTGVFSTDGPNWVDLGEVEFTAPSPSSVFLQFTANTSCVTAGQIQFKGNILRDGVDMVAQINRFETDMLAGDRLGLSYFWSFAEHVYPYKFVGAHKVAPVYSVRVQQRISGSGSFDTNTIRMTVMFEPFYGPDQVPTKAPY